MTCQGPCDLLTAGASPEQALLLASETVIPRYVAGLAVFAPRGLRFDTTPGNYLMLALEDAGSLHQ